MSYTGYQLHLGSKHIEGPHFPVWVVCCDQLWPASSEPRGPLVLDLFIARLRSFRALLFSAWRLAVSTWGCWSRLVLRGLQRGSVHEK